MKQVWMSYTMYGKVDKRGIQQNKEKARFQEAVQKWEQSEDKIMKNLDKIDSCMLYSLQESYRRIKSTTTAINRSVALQSKYYHLLMTHFEGPFSSRNDQPLEHHSHGGDCSCFFWSSLCFEKVL